MNTVACYKVVPDGQDIGTKPDGTLDFSRAKRVLGEYDLMALEEAAHVADATDGKAVLLSAGDAACFDTKLVKAALSRGASELSALSTTSSHMLTRYRRRRFLREL